MFVMGKYATGRVPYLERMPPTIGHPRKPTAHSFWQLRGDFLETDEGALPSTLAEPRVRGRALESFDQSTISDFWHNLFSHLHKRLERYCSISGVPVDQCGSLRCSCSSLAPVLGSVVRRINKVRACAIQHRRL